MYGMIIITGEQSLHCSAQGEPQKFSICKRISDQGEQFDIVLV